MVFAVSGLTFCEWTYGDEQLHSQIPTGWLNHLYPSSFLQFFTNEKYGDDYVTYNPFGAVRQLIQTELDGCKVIFNPVNVEDWKDKLEPAVYKLLTEKVQPNPNTKQAKEKLDSIKLVEVAEIKVKLDPFTGKEKPEDLDYFEAATFVNLSVHKC